MGSETKAVEAEPAVRNLDEFTKKEEKRLLRKLDFFILTYSCFSYFFNYLDRSAFANAYVAGLKEDLHLVGNQYSILLSLTTAGLVIGQVPNALIIQKISPRIWLPSMVILWGCLTMCGAACKNYAQFAAVRFLMGLAEASCYAGCVYILGSWYKPAELAKRTALFTIAGQVGTMFAGAMMAAIQRSMDGHSGLKGWQWVFIIDGVITCPIAIFGYLYFPDTPEKTKAKYLSPRERDLALSRVPPKRADSDSLDPFPLMKRIFAGPEIYCLTGFSILAAALQAFPFQSLFLLYLKHYQDKPFTQTNINTYPIAVQAVGIVSEILTSWYLDKTGHRTRTGLVICTIQIVCAAILLVPNAPHAAAFFAFYTSGSSYAITPLLYGWGNIICIRAGDDAQRAVVIATMVTGGQLLWTWWGIVLYPATDAPYWKKGSIAMICGSVLLGGYLFVVRWLDRRSIAKMPLVVGREAEISSGDERAATTEEKASTRV